MEQFIGVNKTTCILYPGCSNYRTLNETDRNTAYKGVTKCDSGLAKGWYRFAGDAGTQMPTKCVQRNQCGTHAPGWLSGAHPTVAEGAVQRKVCFHWSSGCCQWSRNIQVRNCGGYFVYELEKPPTCSLRYCGEKTQGREIILNVFISCCRKICILIIL